MARETFILYKSFWKPLSLLNDEQLGRLFRAIYLYQCEGVESVSDDIRMAFEFIKNQFEVDSKRYDKTCEARAEAGRRGGLQRVANQAIASFDKQSKQMQANQAEYEYKNEYEYENEYEDVSLYDKMPKGLKERDKLLYILFFRNIRNCENELERFTAFYQGEGRKLTTKQKVGKAVLWTPEDASPRFPQSFLKRWREVVSVLPVELVTYAIADGITYRSANDIASLTCNVELYNWMIADGRSKVAPLLKGAHDYKKLTLRPF